MLKKSKRTLALGAIALCAAVIASACSSSDSPGAQATSSNSSSSGDSSQAAAARAAIAKLDTPPTSLPVTTPLNSKPPTGKTIVYIACNVTQCQEATPFYQAAAAAVGWKLKVLTFDATKPATLTSALRQALQYHPVAVSWEALPYSLWKSVVPAYEQAHVLLMPLATGPTPINKTIIGNLINNAETKAWAAALAEWFIADSDAKGNAVYFGIPSQPTPANFGNSFLGTVKAKCSQCTIKQVNLTLPQVEAGDVNSSIVSALRSDPSAKYVISNDFAYNVGLANALRGAGITDVKIAGGLAQLPDQKAICAGTEAAGTTFPEALEAWLSVDSILRASEGMTVNQSTLQAPFQVLTTSSCASTNYKPSESYTYPTDYVQQFKKLWKVG